MIKTLADALTERGYDTLTPVQEAVTAPELQEADLLVSAQTGSGKTVGFGLAIAPTLLGEAGDMGPAAAPLALVVAPTRELAFQVMRELSWLYAKAGARVVSCVGGMDMRDERRALERGAHIVVGTPGRLRDHIQRGSLELGALRAVVLDEADEMLDLGFREDLEFMLGEAPESRRTLLFSATVPPMIATLAKQYQRDAVRVTTLSGDRQHSDITYQAMKVAHADAEKAIINVLRYHEAQNAIVFANTRAAVSRLTARFANRGFSVVCLSGELSQSERTHALQAMRDGRARVCVATDVAARGIDLPNLDLVVHADLPTNTEGLLHRSGRTGRAGRKGVSVLIVPPREVKKAERLLRWAKVEAEWVSAPDAEEILRRDEARLLDDPAWQEEVSEEQAAFAKRLLEQQSPEAIAAAYLRLYRSGHSAPEELSPPAPRAAPRERGEFGPSTWFALSVGRDDRAEPRWLLPLLCRAGNLDRSHIGAIRVQRAETYVELSDAALPALRAALGGGEVLERGVAIRQLDGPPDLTEPSREGRTGKPQKPHAQKSYGQKQHGEKQHDQKPRAQKPRPKEDAKTASRAEGKGERESARKAERHVSAADGKSQPRPHRKGTGGKPGKAKGEPGKNFADKKAAGKAPGKAPGKAKFKKERAGSSDKSGAKYGAPKYGAPKGGKRSGKAGGHDTPRRGQ
jgi:ATP-dependent RNA helicase DeaD